MQKQDGGHNSSMVVILAVLSFIVICCFYVFGYSTASNKAFSNNSYYAGIAGIEEDPKAVYEKIYRNTFAIVAACNTTMQYASSPIIAGNNYYWIVDGQEVTEELIALSSTDGGYTVYPFIMSASKNIVAPARCNFVNANTTQYEDGIIEIRIRLGSEYELRFWDVESWWCHMDKEEHNRHTMVIGRGGVQEECIAGYIIGMAKSDTRVELYRINGDNTYSPMRLSELFLADANGN